MYPVFQWDFSWRQLSMQLSGSCGTKRRPGNTSTLPYSWETSVHSHIVGKHQYTSIQLGNISTLPYNWETSVHSHIVAIRSIQLGNVGTLPYSCETSIHSYRVRKHQYTPLKVGNINMLPYKVVGKHQYKCNFGPPTRSHVDQKYHYYLRFASWRFAFWQVNRFFMLSRNTSSLEILQSAFWNIKKCA